MLIEDCAYILILGVFVYAARFLGVNIRSANFFVIILTCTALHIITMSFFVDVLLVFSTIKELSKYVAILAFPTKERSVGFGFAIAELVIGRIVYFAILGLGIVPHGVLAHLSAIILATLVCMMHLITGILYQALREKGFHSILGFVFSLPLDIAVYGMIEWAGHLKLTMQLAVEVSALIVMTAVIWRFALRLQLYEDC